MAKRVYSVEHSQVLGEILEDAMAGVRMALIRKHEGIYRTQHEHPLHRDEAFWRDVMKSVIGAVVQTVDAMNNEKTP